MILKLFDNFSPLASRKSRITFWVVWIIGIINLKFGATRCQQSSLLPGVQIIGRCEARDRDVCDARCDQRGMTIWQRKIQCLNGKWSKTPFCDGASVVKSLEMVNCDTLPVRVKNKTFCLKITEKFTRNKRCPDLVTLKLDLQNCSREPLSNCKVSCGEKYDTLKCLPNGKWSHVPKCKIVPLKVCPEPKTGKILNCSRKESEKCKFKCPDGSIINEEITCLESGEWSFVISRKNASVEKHGRYSRNILSRCFCPPPKLPEELIAKENCSRMKTGQTCHLTCKKHFTIIGNNKIMCLQNLSWSAFPECSDKTCPIPWLDESLAFAEDCANKLSGETCKVRCEGTAKLVQKEPFRCINGTEWTKLPHCICHPPVLPDNVITDEDCKNKLVGATCKLKCKQNFSIPHINFIACLTNGTWTSTPTCELNVCNSPDLPRTAVVTKNDCSLKRIGETCTLECLKVPETYEIMCLNTTRWSTYSKCSCPLFISTKNIQFEEDCSGKKPGEKCKVSCKNNPDLNKHFFITCMNNSEWSSEPLCDDLICPTPVLPSYLCFGESCSRKGSQNIYIPNEKESKQDAYQECIGKTVGGTCKVSCKNDGNAIGPNVIVCLDTLKWSPFPTCSCAEPQMPEGLQFTRACQNVMPGSECKLNCEENLELLGNPFIRCLENLTWSNFPICTAGSCSYPQVPDRINVDEICTNKNHGDTCKITCKFGGKLLGSDLIVCLNKSHWSEAPLCTCPKPILNSNVKSVTECGDALPGSECKLVCEKNFEMSEQSIITCGNDSKWSGLQPNCNKSLCQKLPLSRLLVADDSCSSKEPGDKCTLSCKGDGVIIGNATVKCLNSTSWSKLPECGCPQPALNEDIEITGQCKKNIIGSKCNLKCKKGKIVGNSYITCQINASWSSLPICKREFCSKPVLPQGIIEPTEDCSAKEVGDKCSVRCIEGGEFIGPDYIKCLSASNWSRHPSCTCPDPKPYLPENLALEEQCINKRIGMQCKVMCKKSMKLTGNNFIRCGENTKWSNFPRCETLYCPEPNLDKNVLITLKNCRFKTVNETCELACKKGGKLIGKKSITCLNGIEWSTYPKCTCKIPVLKNDLIIAQGEDCSSKEPGMTCKLSCKNGKKISNMDFMMCQNDTEWSPLPTCQDAFCSKPNIPSYLTTQNNCSSTQINENCELNCTGTRTVIDQNYITCLSNLTWTPAPKCTCPRLNSNSNLKGNCSFVIPGANCNVTCKNQLATAEKKFITCNNQSSWDNLNICKRKPCKNMAFPSSSNYVGSCEKKIAGQNCRLRCRGGGVFINNMNTITCNKNGEWTKPRKCVCTSVRNLTHLGLKLKQQCINKNPNDVCLVECINGLDLKDRNFIRCDASFRWTSPPSCEIEFCPAPHIPNAMKMIEGNCSRLKIQTSCKLSCINGALINGSTEPYTLFCSADRKLNKIPTCTCKRPVLPQTVSSPESCEGKEINDICVVHCKTDPRVDRYIACLMHEKWMWSAFPNCPCLPPTHLNKYVALEEACVKSVFPVNTSCLVRCTNFGSTVGANNITCLPGSIWSESPSCTCAPPPPAPPHLSSSHLNLSACQRILPGTSCPVSCLKGTASQNFLHCNATFFWHAYPTCNINCDNPKTMLAENSVGLGPDCESRIEFLAGLICRLKCLTGAEYISPPAIECTDNGTWNSTAFCTCPKPIIPSKEFAFAQTETEECKNKFKGQLCNFVCTTPGYQVKVDQNSLQCEGNSWKGRLSCERAGIWCPNPTLELSLRKIGLINGCSREDALAPTRICYVKCLTPDSVMMIPGQSISTQIVQAPISCSPSGTWLNIPQCSCPILKPEPPYLLRENCNRKFHTQKCLLSLPLGFTFLGINYVECDQGSWGNMPIYLRSKCYKPNTYDPLLIWPLLCDNKLPNEACDLRCRHDAFFMKTQLTTFRITCTQLPTGHTAWSSFPQCACMNVFDSNYRPKDSCAYKRPGEICVIQCVRENAWGQITCDADGSWTSPACATVSDLSEAGSDFMGRKKRHSKAIFHRRGL